MTTTIAQPEPAEAPVIPPMPAGLIEEIRVRIERFCRSLASKDLADLPLYVEFGTDHPTIFTTDAVSGLCSDVLDVILAGAPRPRGRCFVLNDAPLWAGVWRIARILSGDEEPDESSAIDLFDHVLTRTAIHELGHILSENWRYDLPVSSKRLAAHCRAVRCVISGEDVELRRLAQIPFLDHGPRWIRATLHLIERARRRGFEVAPDLVLLLPDCLSSAVEYERELWGEPFRKSRMAISDILREPAPAEFTELWAADFARWKAGIPADQKAEVMRELARCGHDYE